MKLLVTFSAGHELEKHICTKGSMLGLRQEYLKNNEIVSSPFKWNLDFSRIWRKSKLLKMFKKEWFNIFAGNLSKKIWLHQIQQRVQQSRNFHSIAVPNQLQFQSLLPGYKTKYLRKFEMTNHHPWSGSSVKNILINLLIQKNMHVDAASFLSYSINSVVFWCNHPKMKKLDKKFKI